MAGREPISVRPARGSDFDVLAVALEVSLAFPPTSFPRYFDGVGRENVVVATRRGAVVGGLVTYPMGQWFGGRCVPMAGVAGVAVLPEHRATGIGAALMEHAIGEAAARGLPISTLFPATYPVYRRAGYECAGVSAVHRVPPAALPRDDRGPTLRPAVEADDDAVAAVAAERGRRTAGNLERSPWLWLRARRPTAGKVHGFVVEGEAPRGKAASKRRPIEGYVFYTQVYAPPSNHYDLLVKDLAALTPAAGRRLLSFLAAHRSLADRVLLPAAPFDPLLLHLHDHHDVLDRCWEWMTRIVDVKGALEARGYPKGLAAELHLDVRDPMRKANAGRWVLTVADGRGVARRGGRGAVKLDVGALAPLYTGYHSAEALLVTGRVRGAPEDLATASAVFAGPSPWMPDVF